MHGLRLPHIIVALLCIISTDARASEGHSQRVDSILIRFAASTSVGLSIEGTVTNPDTCKIELDSARSVVKNFAMSIDPSILTTGIAVRDRHMRELVFSDKLGNAVPITIRAKDIQLGGASDGDLVAQFEVSFRGVSQTVPVRLKVNGNREAEAEATLSLKGFGVPELDFMGIGVDDEVKITVENFVLAKS